MCGHDFTVWTGYSTVCTQCGVEIMSIELDNFSSSCSVLNNGYDRVQRFALKVSKLLGLHNGPRATDPVWAYLEIHQSRLKTPTDIRHCLQLSKLKCKHYDSLRTFCDIFTDFRVQVDMYRTQSYLVDMFRFLNSKWKMLDESSFFSYCWLLRYLLEKINSPLLVYLKPPTCRRRSQKYLRFLDKLFKQSPRMGDDHHHDTPDTRLHNVITASWNRPNISHQHGCPFRA